MIFFPFLILAKVYAQYSAKDRPKNEKYYKQHKIRRLCEFKLRILNEPSENTRFSLDQVHFFCVLFSLILFKRFS